MSFRTVLTFLCSFPTAFGGVSQTVGVPAHAPADYVIFQDAQGKACLESARSHRVLARGIEAAAIIQQAIDRLPENGGAISISSGSYKLMRTLVIRDKHGVHLEGAARGMQGRQKGGTVLWSDQPIHLLEIYGGDKRIFGVTVSNLLLYGSGKDNGKAGIWVHGTTDTMTFYNVGVNQCGIGFHLQGVRGTADSGVIDAAQIYFCDPQINGTGMLIERAHYTKIVGGEFSDCDHEGIRLSSPGGMERVQGVKILGVTAVRNRGAGIFIGKNCEDITVGGGTDVGGTRQGSGIVISAEANAPAAPRNIIINGVHSYNNEADGITIDQARNVIVEASICSVHDHAAVKEAPQKAGIRIRAGSGRVVLNGNITYGNREAGIADESGRALVSGNSEEEKK